MSRKRSFWHYLGIAAAVCVGALAARLILLWALASVAEEQIKGFADQAQESSDRIVAKARQRQTGRRAVTEQQRRDSKTGKDLLRRCNEFSQFYRDYPGEYAREEMDRACGRFRAYVESGRVVR